jgi:hypothetical protein
MDDEVMNPSEDHELVIRCTHNIQLNNSYESVDDVSGADSCGI